MGEDSVLRPEGTTGAVSYFLRNFYPTERKNLYYYGSMFRHERAQKGRYREFTQFGIEKIGFPANPLIDVEVINLAQQLLKKLDVNYKLIINDILNVESR